MNKPEAMSTEERESFDGAVRLVRNYKAAGVQLTATDQYLLMAADHIEAIQKRNFNLANEYQRLNQILDTEIRKSSRSAWYEGYEAGHADEFETAANPYEEE
jgi:hypothetical protein